MDFEMTIQQCSMMKNIDRGNESMSSLSAFYTSNNPVFNAEIEELVVH